eukprot:357166-Chlamydomonas_euryale.AAC.9
MDASTHLRPASCTTLHAPHRRHPLAPACCMFPSAHAHRMRPTACTTTLARPHAPDCRRPTACNPLQAPDCMHRTACTALHAPDRMRPTVGSILHATHCMHPTA